jgi:phosphoglycolate phosphatase
VDTAQLRGVLFDKDGTLIDLHASWVASGLETARALCALAGAPERFDWLVREAGYDAATARLAPRSLWASGTTEALVRHWLAQLGIGGADAMVARTVAAMTAQAAASAVPLADLRVLFAQLSARGLCVGVATMDLESGARAVLARLGVLEAVDFVCGCDSGHGEKPGPGMVLAFCRACGLEPAQVMVVGDTPHDMHMARAAGAGVVVAVTSGAADAAMLGALCNHLIADISELGPCLAMHAACASACGPGA